METKYPTWEELVAMEPGTIVRQWMQDEVACIIMRATSSLTAYVGVPIDHPMAGRLYDLPLEVHGGLTFGRAGNDDPWPKDIYWYGWDYAHGGDYCYFYDKECRTNPELAKYAEMHNSEHKWLVQEVEREVFDAAYELQVLMREAEEAAEEMKKMSK